MPRKHNPFDNYKAVLDKAAEMLGLTQNDYIILKYPERSLRVSLPIRMDNGEVRVFEASACSTRPRAGRARAASATIRMWTRTRSRRWRRG